jgi:hypothetical protein
MTRERELERALRDLRDAVIHHGQKRSDDRPSDEWLASLAQMGRALTRANDLLRDVDGIR